MLWCWCGLRGQIFSQLPCMYYLSHECVTWMSPSKLGCAAMLALNSMFIYACLQTIIGRVDC